MRDICKESCAKVEVGRLDQPVVPQRQSVGRAVGRIPHGVGSCALLRMLRDQAIRTLKIPRVSDELMGVW